MIGAKEDPVGPSGKAEQLEEIGVAEQVLVNAIMSGDGAAARCTANHPPMAHGFYRFAETMRSLGDQLAPLGWTRRDYKNFSTVVRPDGRVAIAVASGDPGTGDMAASVTTRSPKGAVTQEAVETNLKLPLDERYVADNQRIIDGPKTLDPATWFLLHDRRGGIIYSELSFPQSMDDNGYVRKWLPRIPLRPQSISPINVEFRGGEPPVNPIIDVKRREPE
jgi:hypothetical protein